MAARFSGPRMLEVSQLNAGYGRAHILHDIVLQAGAGEVVALLGRNGAGKSTTMKSIMGLVPHVSGQISFDGRMLAGVATHRISRAGLGYVPEDRRVFPDLTVEENLEVGRRARREDAPYWSVGRLYELFPNLGERRRNLGKHLSGGEQQMLSIARSLMGNPKLVLLDEPSEGIAPVIAEQMAQVIAEMKREGLSVLLSEQNLHFAGLVADRAYILETGRVRYDGTFAEIMASPDITKQYLAV